MWDELGTTDADAAQRFYEEVFGWTTDMGEEFGGYRIFDRPGETGKGPRRLMKLREPRASDVDPLRRRGGRGRDGQGYGARWA